MAISTAFSTLFSTAFSYYYLLNHPCFNMQSFLLKIGTLIFQLMIHMRNIFALKISVITPLNIYCQRPIMKYNFPNILKFANYWLESQRVFMLALLKHYSLNRKKSCAKSFIINASFRSVKKNISENHFVSMSLPICKTLAIDDFHILDFNFAARCWN